MKNFYITLLSLFFFSNSFSQITAKRSGDWSSKNTWDLNRVPKNGDVVVIPSGRTVNIEEEHINLSSSKVELNIHGQLFLDEGRLSLGGDSKVVLHETGRIYTDKEDERDNIRIGGIIKYSGNQDHLRGPKIADKTTGSYFRGFAAMVHIVLPVKIASFSVIAKSNQVVVQWATAEEIGASYFEVQRSLNGTDWSTVGQVKAAGNTNQITEYSFIDKNKVSSKVYYRIKQADATGKTAYTGVQTITNAAANQVNIIAYQSKVAVQFAQPVKGKTEVVIVNRAGQVVARQVVENGAGQVVLNNTTSLKGAYFVAVNNGTGIGASQQIIL